MEKRLGKLFCYWLPPLVWMALIFWASSFHTLRASPVNWQDFVIRKAAHFLEYAVLAALFFRAFKKTTKFPLQKIFWLAFVLSVFYAATDEFHQTLVSGRSGMVRDIFIDALGCLSGLFFVKASQKKFDKKGSNIL